MEKIIALIDCDSFFVSCEQAENPDLKHKPVCVLSNNDACIVSRSKEAKQMGIPMGIPLFMAKQDFPDVIYISGRHEIYRNYSERVMKVIEKFCPQIQIYSIDEAFADITGLDKYFQTDYSGVAKLLQKEVKDKTDIPVSIGVSSSKTLAKYASDKSKNTDGIMVILDNYDDILKDIEISDIWGIGRNLSKKMTDLSMYTAKDITEKTDKWLSEKFGKNGVMLKYELLGKSMYPLEEEKPPQSIQDTSSLRKPTNDKNKLKSELNFHIHTACQRLRRFGGYCSSVEVMLKTKDFKYYVLKDKLDYPTNFELDISKVIYNLFEKIYTQDTVYRSTGIVLDDISYTTETQLSLFENNTQESSKIAKALDKINNKYGQNSIHAGFYKK
ncbi:hypothetical protein IJI31_03625 [bacterium]|nr:hypothetical protein [bacterium]